MSTSSTVLFTDLNLCSWTYIKGYFLILPIEMTTPTTKTSLFTKSNWILKNKLPKAVDYFDGLKISFVKGVRPFY